MNITDSLNKIVEPILITGATGFIGRHLIDRLIANRHREIIAFDLPGSLIPAHWQQRVEFRAGDISNTDAVNQALKGAGTIFHLAAVVGDWGKRELFWNVTVKGSENVYRAALNNSSRLFLASSIVVYGDRIGKEICHEDLAFGRPKGYYSQCKQLQEARAWELHRSEKLKLTVVRPANVYGPGSKPWLQDVSTILRKGQPSLIDGGKFNAGLVYVENLIDLFILAAINPIALGRIYNGCDDNGVSWQRYFSDIANLVGAPPPRSLPRGIAKISAVTMESIWKLFGIKTRPPLTREALNLIGSDHQISIKKAREELGFQPRVSYQDGLKNIAEFLRS